jgi:4'-phosphopantetheinyl transferase EntD
LFWLICITAAVLLTPSPSRAQKLVDPDKVAPEYREAAEKRRAEQIAQRQCAMKAEVRNVLPRDRTAFLLECLQGKPETK